MRMSKLGLEVHRYEFKNNIKYAQNERRGHGQFCFCFVQEGGHGHMNHKNYRFSKGKFARFMSSKGFYTAVAVCLVGAGAATWLAVDRTLSGIEDNNNRILQAETNVFPPLEEVEQKQPDIPKVSPPSSLPAMPPSLPEPPSEPEEPSKPVEAPPPSPALVYSLPLRGDVINQYSGGELVKNTTLGDWRTHDGVDIAAEKGADIYAAADATVTDIKQDPLWGTVLTLSHADGRISIYSGLEERLPVKVGDSVMAKQVIGKLEGVPCEMADGPHLHFAMKEGNTWLDPLAIAGTVE
jgi:murein DD-endopeptidase MepM/ murein hydrolase activator NlpD